jgi:SAM-dependent methyltransferase
MQRDRIWDVFPYPCVGEFGFLDLNLSERAAYPRILEKLQASESARHLDIGCCVGQDIRKLVHDGVPSEQIVGLELEKPFVDLGYELFRDGDKMNARFVIANMLDDSNEELDGLNGVFDIVHIGQVLHLFNYDEQFKFLKRVIRLCKDEPGVLIVGHCLGHVQADHYCAVLKRPLFRHNVESWAKLWGELSTETGSKWELKTDLDTRIGYGPRRSTWRDPNWRRLVFEVVRK